MSFLGDQPLVLTTNHQNKLNSQWHWPSK